MIVVRTWALTISVAGLLVVGCSSCSSSTDGGTPTVPTEVTVSDLPSDPTSQPAPEPTDPESTQSQETKPSIEIASLPIGGVPDDGQKCNPVSWLGGDLPEGVTIKLGTPRFEPPGIFEVDQSACSGDAQSQACEGLEWTTSSQTQCWVGFKQVADSGRVTLVVPAKAFCTTQDACDGLSNLGGSQIGLSAQPPEPPAESSETPETPTG